MAQAIVGAAGIVSIVTALCVAIWQVRGVKASVEVLDASISPVLRTLAKQIEGQTQEVKDLYRHLDERVSRRECGQLRSSCQRLMEVLRLRWPGIAETRITIPGTDTGTPPQT